ncbi:MAG: hypothetical protein QOJ66_2902 [Ilumatobacteraceae bacterium]
MPFFILLHPFQSFAVVASAPVFRRRISDPDVNIVGATVPNVNQTRDSFVTRARGNIRL